MWRLLCSGTNSKFCSAHLPGRDHLLGPTMSGSEYSGGEPALILVRSITGTLLAPQERSIPD